MSVNSDFLGIKTIWFIYFHEKLKIKTDVFDIVVLFVTAGGKKDAEKDAGTTRGEAKHRKTSQRSSPKFLICNQIIYLD